MISWRLILAGLLAGLVLNVGEAVLHGVVLADATVQAMAALGRSEGSSAAGLAMLIGITFVQGVVGVWLYALLLARATGSSSPNPLLPLVARAREPMR